jgi:serine/threonine-protein kinase
MLVPVGSDPEFVKVLDFGVARVGEADSSLATHAGAVLGTAAYACPEIARGEQVGPPGDVYSMATLLFESLTGRTPFLGKSPVDVLIQHAQSAIPDLRTLARAAVAEPLVAVISRALSKNPRDRYRDGRDFGCALLDAARDSGLDGEALVGRVTLTGSSNGARERAPSTTLVATSTAAAPPLRAAERGAS